MACGVDSASGFKRSSLLPDSTRIDELRDILRSNVVPPEISSFRRVAEEAPAELARYDAEIERLKESIDQLSSERATLAWYSDGCRSVASPVRRLPTELLAEVFDMCAPEGQEVMSETTTSTEEVERLAKKYLLQLAQVCSRWRSVAMGTPNLWSLIVLDTAVWDDSDYSSQTLLNLVASSLQRGGGCSLTLRIAVGHGDPAERSVLELLSEHSRRWRRMFLWIHPLSFPHLSRAKGNLGRLGFLGLASVTTGDQIHTASDIFQIAPRLSEVWLVNWEDPVPVLPWNQLSFVALRLFDGVPPAGTMQILRLLPKSVALLIEPNTLSTPIQLPILSNIDKLTVDLVGAPRTHPNLGTLFQSLTLPRLKLFRLVRKGLFPRWEQSPFLDFVSRSALQTTLTSLRIDVVITDHELLECLAALPLLEKLYIADSDEDHHPAVLTDHLLQMLKGGSDNTCLVPALFSLQFTSRFTFNNALFWDFVASRVRHRRFKHNFKIVAYWCKSRDYGFSPEFNARRLRRLEAAGGFVFETGRAPEVKQIHDTLRSNAVPPDISGFRRVAEEAPVELARYDAEIERLGELTAKLSSERATLAWYSDGCRSVTSPVRRLPTELLAEIFDMCAPEGQDVISDMTTLTEEIERLAKKYLLQLAQVCSHWRSVAMGTSTLWSQIVLDTAVWSRIPHYSPTLLDLLASSLQRGGECPLTLQIAVDHGNRNERSVLNLLSEHSHRWRRVALWIDPPSFSHLARAKGNLGHLGSLRLAGDTARTQNEVHPASDIFHIAPRLSEVWLADWEDPVPVLPWNQLSFAALRLVDGVPPAGTMQILRLLPKSVALLIEPNTVSTPLQLPILSNIDKLTVDLVGAPRTHPILGTLFQSLTLPRLQSFRLIRKGLFPRWEQSPFLDFVSRSSLRTTLTSLRIEVVITDHELLECLAALPLLEKLRIADSDDDSHPAVLTDHLLQMLKGGSDDTYLAPALFYLQFTSRFTFNNTLFWDFIASRVRHRRFEHDFQVVAYWCKSRDYGFSPEFNARRLRKLEAAGGFVFETGRAPERRI
ncbi:hypothetical protein C8R46DRAFT_1355461 [Mycena filopes]|nr:hypothetical protein C8R46DRAFT_1355461 [Mycena filopes]